MQRQRRPAKAGRYKFKNNRKEPAGRRRREFNGKFKSRRKTSD
jgi:hypothetical protein